MLIRKIPRSDFWLTPTRLISGLMTALVNVVTSAVNAVPMTTAVDRSMMLPRERNSLNPLNIGDVLPGTGQSLLSARRPTSARGSVQGEGYRLAQRRARYRV